FLPQQGVWHGVAKVPETTPLQTGLDMDFLPDFQVDAGNRIVPASPQPRRPLLAFVQYVGDLGLTTAQSVYQLDTSKMTPGGASNLELGQSFTLPSGIVVSFTGLKKYSVFELASNPGAPILLLAAILILVGLIPALYSSRRRIWVRAAPLNGVARLEIAGQAMQRKAAFEEEFKTFVRDLDKDLHQIGAPDG